MTDDRPGDRPPPRDPPPRDPDETQALPVDDDAELFTGDETFWSDRSEEAHEEPAPWSGYSPGEPPDADTWEPGTEGSASYYDALREGARATEPQNEEQRIDERPTEQIEIPDESERPLTTPLRGPGAPEPEPTPVLGAGEALAADEVDIYADIRPEGVEQATTAFPSMEELTFTPRAPEEPAPGPPVEPSEPVRLAVPRGFRPSTLTKRRAATLAAFCEALLPRGGPVPHSASDVGVAERVDAALGAWAAEARRRFTRALTFFEWQSILSRSFRPFSRLRPDRAVEALERASTSRWLLRRATFDLIKFYAGNQWAATPQVEQAIGYTYSCIDDSPARDGEKLEVLSFPQVTRDHAEECDVVVIGSGAGGAVVAKEMAELGLSVIVLEEGGYFTRNDFTGPPFERFQKLYRQQGMTAAFGAPPIPIPLGMAVGGTTLVNSGTCFRTPYRVLLRWGRETGVDGIDGDSMKPYFDRVERIQRVKTVPDALLGPNARTFERGVQALGLRGAPVQRNIEGCRGCGTCAFGCPSDAKLSTHLTYLPRAQKAGATIYANTRAERILVEDGRARGVLAFMVDPKSREKKVRLRINAKVVVVAAGAIHTPALLAENAIGNASGMLGLNLQIHPATAVGAFFDEEIHAWRGTLQPYFVSDWHESHDIMIEVTSSVPSIGAGTFPGAGARYKQMLGAYPHFASAGMFVSDTSKGRVVRRPGREPVISYRLNKHDTQRIVEGLIRTSEIFLAAGARAVHTGIPGVEPVQSRRQLEEIATAAVRPRALRLTAFHPVGTARMGVDPATSVVDPFGEVHGVPGLYVADASVLPGCPTVNPMITIMAFATRTADHLARHGSRYF